MNTKQIDIQAEKILSGFGLKDIPVPIEKIVKSFDIEIGRAPSSKFSGLLLRKDGKSLIGINSSETFARQRFSMAHELGHFILHETNDTFVDYRNNQKGVPRTQKEMEADTFAASLLMPKTFLERDFQKLAQNGFNPEYIGILAETYQVSSEAMSYRLISLHLT